MGGVMTRITDRHLILILFVLGLCAASTSMSAATVSHQTAEASRPARVVTLTESGHTHADWLVDATWLKAHLNDSKIKVIALTGSSEFKSGHIPGAAQIDWTDLGLADTSDPSIIHWQADIEQKLSRLGISRSDTVLIYDDGTLYAPRLWWILDQLGHQDKRILNGGLIAWTNAGGKIEKGASRIHPATQSYKGASNATALATLNEVKAVLDDPNVVLVDARTPAEYVKGHIPGAINIPFIDNAVATAPKVWKSREDLRAMYEAAGVTPDKTVIPYCSTGVRSAATYFTLALLGYPHVSLYTGSFDEWSKHPELRTSIGQKP
jgi:thiosulfate/3-mercaptopyruvate sulfurtransferase